ncbi:MAG: HNH endonuclease, partial [Deltaproteobacteria bacterium]
GRVVNRRNWHIVTPKRARGRHLRVTLCGFQFLVHRLVAEAFIGSCPEAHEINHKDCDPSNNHVSNLEWVTRKENIAHAVKMGRFAKKKKCVTKTLTKYPKEASWNAPTS